MPDASINYAETKTDGTAKTKVTVTVDGTTTALPAAKLDNDTPMMQAQLSNRPQTGNTVSGTKSGAICQAALNSSISQMLFLLSPGGMKMMVRRHRRMPCKFGTDANVNATLKSGSGNCVCVAGATSLQ